MAFESFEALRRLQELLPKDAAARWLRGARVRRRRGGIPVLHVQGPMEKRWFETLGATALRSALGEGALVEAAVGDAAPDRSPVARPRLNGPAGEYALRLVRSFVEGGPAATPLLVLHGPPRCGSDTLVRWALGLGGRRIFRLDLERLRSGGSRELVPRKPLVVVEGLERIAGRPGAQRTLCTLLDGVWARGARVLATIEGHPGDREGLLPALRSRLQAGVPVPLPAPGPAEVRLELRDRARERGRRLPRGWEEELAALPVDAALRALDLRFGGAHDAGRAEVRGPLERMKDIAARLFEVERETLDLPIKRRSVVEARRSVMAAGTRAGLPPEELARAFGIASTRVVREACRWAERQEKRSDRYSRMIHEVGKALH